MPKPEPATTDFSRFFFDATEEEKITLLREVVRLANQDQMDMLKAARTLDSSRE